MLLPSSRIYLKAIQQNLMYFILLYLFCHCFFFSIISSGPCVTFLTILILLQERGFHSNVPIFPADVLSEIHAGSGLCYKNIIPSLLKTVYSGNCMNLYFVPIAASQRSTLLCRYFSPPPLFFPLPTAT